MESNEQIRQQFFKMNFFKKVWYSISKFEKYPEMAALGVKRAILYLTEIVLIMSIIFTGIYVYYIKNIAEFDEEGLNFSEKLAIELTRNSKIENKETIIENLKNEKSEVLIVAIGIAFLMSDSIETLVDVFILSAFGVMTCIVAKIKMNYKALFNMSIYAFTLPIILRTIYFAITNLTTFEIKYFDVMYVAIAYISLAAAIFIIKSNVIKQHLELMRIIEESKEKIEEKIPIRRKTKDDENKDEEKNEEENDDEDKNSTESEGSNA